MEVHAHAHTPRKKWTHYFWEFLSVVPGSNTQFHCRKPQRTLYRT